MSRSHSLTSVDISEYDRIEAAMTESDRGRWFLDAYLRRNRTNDTGILLDAITRLETVVTQDRESSQIGRVRGDLMDMAHAIARTKAEIAAINAPDHDQSRLGGASAALDAIVRSTERATSDILSAAEHVQEAAWTLRESGSDAAICDDLDRHATAIYTACSFQDLTAQRTARIIHTLRYLEERLAAMMAIWGDALDPVPAGPGAPEVPADLCQSDVDRYIDMDGSSAEPVPPVAPTLNRLPSDPPAADDIVFLEVTDAAPESTFEVHDEVQEEVGTDQGDTSSEAAVTAEAAQEENSDSHGSAQADPAFDAGIHPDETAAGDDRPVPMMASTLQVSEQAQTDVATAFAEIDALSEDEKRALFS